MRDDVFLKRCCCSCYYSITIPRYSGKYLCRRIPHASNGSFNPYVITNKHAHIINGNIFSTDNTDSENKSATISTEANAASSTTSPNTVPRHFINYCFKHPGKFSCAVDCFLELSCVIFVDSLQNVNRNPFFEILYHACLLLQNSHVHTDLELLREPVWAWLRQHCPSFTDMSANAVFSDIFRLTTVGQMNMELKSLFLIQQTNQSFCCTCTHPITKCTSVFVLYMTSRNLSRHNKFEFSVSEAILPNSTTLYCDLCQTYSGDISLLQHFVTMPEFLTIELSSNSINCVVFPSTMEVLGCWYSLKSLVRCRNHHFTVAINMGTYWIYIDDLCISFRIFPSVDDLLHAFPGGWFFAIFQKCTTFAHSNTQANALPAESISASKNSQQQLFSTVEKITETLSRTEQEDDISTNTKIKTESEVIQTGKNPHLNKQNRCIRANKNVAMKKYKCKKLNSETSIDKQIRRANNNIYMRQYRQNKTNNITNKHTQIKRAKANAYMRQYRQKETSIVTNEDTQIHRAKTNAYMKKYRQNKTSNVTNEDTQIKRAKANTYMKQYRRKKTNNKTEHNAYMRQYRQKKTKNETEENTQIKRAKTNAYMKKSKKKNNSESKKDKQIRRAKKRPPMKEYRNKTGKRIRTNSISADPQSISGYRNSFLDQQTYLHQFDSTAHGHIHEQKWARTNMEKFHKSMKLKITLCVVCCEAWPLPLNSRKQKLKTFICSRCTRDKGNVKKFSVQNNMIPSPVPKELYGLTQIEEMLIARVFPVISVYTKPGGQRAYKGHCINFPQNIQQLADTLPRYPKQLPIIIVTVNGKTNTSKDLTVRREKVSSALHWLIKHNPVYKDVKIDYNCLAALPLKGIPNDLTNINCDADSAIDTHLDEDRGPLDIDEIPCNEETELSSTLLNPVELKQQKELIMDEVLQTQRIQWPERDTKAINEFKTELLATMAFPTLFPDGKGDPTNSATKRNVTLGEKVKHLIRFGERINDKWEYRFASHPRFAYWAFNMLQRHRLLAQGSVYLKQNPGDSHLSVQQLKQMLTSNTYSTFMSKLMHYSKNVTGSTGYWNKAKEDLKATITQVGPPTIFFTLSCAEYHWPEFHNLFTTNLEELTPNQRQQHVIQNPHILDWLFTDRTDHFVKFWLKETLGSSWHWYRYEYAVQRGSIHCHGVAKLKNDPGLCQLTETALKGFLAAKHKDKSKETFSKQQLDNLHYDINQGKEAEKIVCQYADFLMSTWNPCTPDEGWSKPDKHPCQQSFLTLPATDMHKDYIHLLNSVERHTTCSTKYCLRQNDKSELFCRFHYPFDSCTNTRIDFEPINTKTGETKYKATIVTKRNDSRLNRHQPLQLQGWRANCDIQIILDYHACLEYLVKYTSKAEKMSSVVKSAFTNVVNKMTDTSDVDSTIKQLMLKTVGQRDYSIQEVMHHLLSLKFVSATQEVVTASLDGSRRITIQNKHQSCTSPSMLDIYAERGKYIHLDPQLLQYNFTKFVSSFSFKMSKLQRRKKEVVVKTYPNYSSNPENEHYGLFCKYQLLKYKPWKLTPADAWNGLPEKDDTFITCWKTFLSSELAKVLVPDWETKMQAVNTYLKPFDHENLNENISLEDGNTDDEREEWMFMAELNVENITEFNHSIIPPDGYWQEALQFFSKDVVDAMPRWISRQKNQNDTQWNVSVRTIDVTTFTKGQQLAYEIIQDHYNSFDDEPLFLLLKGLAGCGKSYVIDALRNLLLNKCRVLAYTGKAACNVNGITLHSLLKLPIGPKRLGDLKGIPLQQLQNSLESVRYLIIDEYSFVGQSLFAWIDSRCRQATGKENKLFGGISVILVGDIAQLPPVGDKPLFHSMPKTDKQVQGLLMYHQFKTVVALTENQRVKGDNAEQTNFRELLTRARNGDSTESDWETLISRTPNKVHNIDDFEKFSVRLCYHKKKVAELNLEKLKRLNKPIAVIKARHSRGAHAISSDNMGGLEAVVYLAKGAKVMLTMNLWTDVGLCNGALGTVIDFIYSEGQQPPCLPICVLVQFDQEYRGPSVSSTIPNLVPICPVTQSSDSVGNTFERQQLPIRLAWAITIHRCQGLTLPKAWIDLGASEKVAGLTYVALSRVKKLADLVIEPMTLERLQAARKLTNLQFRIKEEERLDLLAKQTLYRYCK